MLTLGGWSSTSKQVCKEAYPSLPMSKRHPCPNRPKSKILCCLWSQIGLLANTPGPELKTIHYIHHRMGPLQVHKSANGSCVLRGRVLQENQPSTGWHPWTVETGWRHPGSRLYQERTRWKSRGGLPLLPTPGWAALKMIVISFVDLQKTSLFPKFGGCGSKIKYVTPISISNFSRAWQSY